MAIMLFKVIQDHRFWYQSKACMQLPISDYRRLLFKFWMKMATSRFWAPCQKWQFEHYTSW